MTEYTYDLKVGAYTKECTICKEVFVGVDDQHESEEIFKRHFYLFRLTHDGFQPRCINCEKKSKSKKRESKIKEKLEAQGYKCIICHGSLVIHGTYGNEKAQYDHDHTTGEFRGMLCRRCNLGMSYIDNEEWLSTAIAYRNSHRKED